MLLQEIVGKNKGGFGPLFNKYIMKTFKSLLQEFQLDQPDVVQVNIPLLIRLSEFAKEDAKSDLDLHKAVENMLVIRSETNKPLSMDDYNRIVKMK